MARFLSTTAGQFAQFLRLLASAGFDDRQIERVLMDRTLAVRMFEAIQPMHFPIVPPKWWVLPELQLERAHRLWPKANLPEPPEKFTPKSATEVLLLHVPDTFMSLWGKIELPPHYRKGVNVYTPIDLNERHVRLAPNKQEYTKPVWLAIETEHAHNVAPAKLWGMSKLAAGEVLSAVIQFPDWIKSWGVTASIPMLSGYQYNDVKVPTLPWSHVLFLDIPRQITLDMMTALGRRTWDSESRKKLMPIAICDARYGHGSNWASPSIREL